MNGLHNIDIFFSRGCFTAKRSILSVWKVMVRGSSIERTGSFVFVVTPLNDP
jgi:hypothetical protein